MRMNKLLVHMGVALKSHKTFPECVNDGKVDHAGLGAYWANTEVNPHILQFHFECPPQS